MPLNESLDKLLAWNEVSLKIPGSWEVEQLEKTYIFIAGEDAPRMELKWTRSPRRFTLEAYVKDFMARSRRQLGMEIREQAGPSFFSHPDPGLVFFFFSWQRAETKGWGTMVFCTHCRKLSLIRFFGRTGLSPGSRAEQILHSYSDHPTGPRTPWSIFGMRFSLPCACALKDHRFTPGSFSLTFSCPKTGLSVFSWGPASFLLSKTDLNGFARQRIPRLKGLARAGESRRGAFLEWEFRDESFRGAARLPLFSFFSRFCVFRICRDRNENRIFGILTESSRCFETGLIRESFIGDG